MAKGTCDCLIVGGGPAGCALAILLAQRGRAVMLVDHGRAHYSGPNETLLGSSMPMLERTGLGILLTTCAQPDPLRHGAIWGSDALQWREPGHAGLWLQRGPFDEAMRTTVAARGVRVVCPARVRFDDAGGGAKVLFADGRGEHVEPALSIVATGRSSLQALVPAREESAGPSTLAFTWVGEPDDSDRGTAVVEAVPEGWIWTHVPAAGSASAAVLLDQEQLEQVGREALLERAFANARGPARRLRARQLVYANDATARYRTTAAKVMLLGDASATIDPLASQGVEKALAGADHAAAAVGTALQNPEWWPRLRDLHARWERGLFTAHRAVSTAFVQREQRFRSEPFWQRRAESAPSDVAPATGTKLVRASTVLDGNILVRHGDQF
ncbi:MAG: FAD-dependent monooxygenase, partial [Planctomycetota bacterium]